MIGHRTLKRVPMKFDWPIGKVWKGYLQSDDTKEPPRGRGYQLWEIVSEGSPMSPVFATPEELAVWCAQNATIFGNEKITAQEWLNLFRGKGNLEEASLGVITPDGNLTSAATASKSKSKRRKQS